MSKAITLNSAWQSRSASFSTHASRKGVNLLGWDCEIDESMTDEQKREALGAHRKYLETVLARFRVSGNRDGIRLIGQKIAQTNAQINAIRPCRHDRDLSHYIVDILKSRVTKSEWQRIGAEARLLKDREEA
ncbi:hypothetical protein G3N58_17695 [Paraburkholderia sp. Ac-20342]|uniref:hypothetical protein n=1 Tax=Paraburkholderia sp. Ac-20342 TaxID=2703889 RepID=UPI00197F82C9|nr:hypothetical protein [Paraburkholderia sp. Ac-20342]MBN3848642.1 hypothetical protein [Paraburkholderia sp. Ac-20342]